MPDEKKDEKKVHEDKFADKGLRGFTVYDENGKPVSPVRPSTPKK